MRHVLLNILFLSRHIFVCFGWQKTFAKKHLLQNCALFLVFIRNYVFFSLRSRLSVSWAFSGREETMECKLHWSPRFFSHIILGRFFILLLNFDCLSLNQKCLNVINMLNYAYFKIFLTEQTYFFPLFLFSWNRYKTMDSKLLDKLVYYGRLTDSS